MLQTAYTHRINESVILQISRYLGISYGEIIELYTKDVLTFIYFALQL